MKALTLMQPWAQLVILEEKCNETRSWRTAYRGDLAIHASSTFPKWAKALCSESPFREVLTNCGVTAMADLPLGVMVGVVRLVDCVSTILFSATDQERDFGNYACDRFVFRFANVRRLQHPVGCRGMLGLWTVPPEVEKEVRRQLS